MRRTKGGIPWRWSAQVFEIRPYPEVATLPGVWLLEVDDADASGPLIRLLSSAWTFESTGLELSWRATLGRSRHEGKTLGSVALLALAEEWRLLP